MKLKSPTGDEIMRWQQSLDLSDEQFARLAEVSFVKGVGSDGHRKGKGPRADNIPSLRKWRAGERSMSGVRWRILKLKGMLFHRGYATLEQLEQIPIDELVGSLLPDRKKR